MIKPKILFIDWNGTLSNSKFWGHLENSSLDNQKLFKSIENYLFKQNTNLIGPWMRAEFTSEDINKKISEELKFDFDTISREFIKGCKQMEFVGLQIPKLTKDIRNSGIKVYIATDNMDSFDRWTVPVLKLKEMFDGIINSFSIKALKRDFDSDGKSLFFNEVLKSEGVKPSETILIDDAEDKESVLTNYGINYTRISNQNTLEMNLLNILKLA